MGGVNCNCDSNWATGSLDKKTVNDYVNGLAIYCENLFGGVARFFEANAAIERSVIAQDCTFALADSFLEDGICKFEEAKLSLGSFAAKNANTNVNDFKPDFVFQLENITQAIVDMKMSQELLRKAADSKIDDPQKALWLTKNLTQTFATTLDSVQQTAYWQSDFAIRVRHGFAIAV